MMVIFTIGVVLRLFVMNEILGINNIKINFPKDGKLRSRKVVSRSRHRVTGKYPSWKMNRMIEWESKNELNAFRLLDASSIILEFNEQPMTIHYILNGVEACY